MNVIERDLKYLTQHFHDEKIEYAEKTVLVTGGAGFLGSWICDVLVRLGSKVICLDNFSSGRPENIEHLKPLTNFRLIKHDISQPIFLNEKSDIVLHLASRASPLEFSSFSIQILKTNTIGTWISLGIAKKQGAMFLLASSSEVYGDPDPSHIPTPETYYGNVNPVGVRSCYDEAKRAAEAFVTAYHVQHGLDTRIVRIHNTYGPRMRAGDVYGRVISRFIDQALRGKPLTVFGDGTQTRSFTYVSDMVEGILKMAYQPNLGGEVINLGSDDERRIIDLAKMIIKLTNSNSEIEFQHLPPDDPKRRCPDLSKAKKLLGWNPKTSLRDGLAKTISWFQHELAS